jgi:hypothetical protein
MPVPDFSPGEVLTAAAMDSIGLWLVKTQTVGTTVSSVTVTGAFSADYDNYLITYNGIAGSANTVLRLTLGSTSSQYYYGFIYQSLGSATINGLQGQNQASWFYAVPSTTNETAGSIELWNPFLTKRTSVRSNHTEFVTTGAVGQFVGYLNNTTSYTAFTLTPNAGTITNGTIRVYGYRN